MRTNRSMWSQGKQRDGGWAKDLFLMLFFSVVFVLFCWCVLWTPSKLYVYNLVCVCMVVWISRTRKLPWLIGNHWPPNFGVPTFQASTFHSWHALLIHSDLPNIQNTTWQSFLKNELFVMSETSSEWSHGIHAYDAFSFRNAIGHLMSIPW